MSYNPFGYSYSQSTKTMSSTSSSTVFSAEIMQPQLIDQSWRFTNSNGFTRFHPSQHQERFPFYPMAPTAYSMGSACSVSSSPPISPHNPNKQFFFGEQNMPHYSMSERVWSPLDVSTLPQTLIENKSQVNRESTYTCTQYSMSPISPRPIKKTIKKTDPVAQNKVVAETMMRSKDSHVLKTNGISQTSNKKSACLPETTPKHKNFMHSSSRQLPIRSKNVDLSSYLNRASESDCSSPMSSPVSSESSPSSNTCSLLKSPPKTFIKCSFCENNGEKKEIYMSHPLKDSLGKIVCPILRQFACPKCGESGDYAHTNKYCPETQRKQKENKIKKCFFANAKNQQ